MIATNKCSNCGKQFPLKVSKYNKTYNYDHVVAKCLFSGNERNSMEPSLPQVASCDECNLGNDDEAAKEFSMGYCQGIGTAVDFNLSNMQKATLKNNASLRKKYDSAIRTLALNKDTTSYQPIVIIDRGDELTTKAKNAYKRYARGLFRNHFNIIVSQKTHDVTVEFEHNHNIRIEGDINQAKELLKKRKNLLNDLKTTSERVDLLPGIFSYWAKNIFDKNSGGWIIIEYRSKLNILCFILPK